MFLVWGCHVPFEYGTLETGVLYYSESMIARIVITVRSTILRHTFSRIVLNFNCTMTIQKKLQCLKIKNALRKKGHYILIFIRRVQCAAVSVNFHFSIGQHVKNAYY